MNTSLPVTLIIAAIILSLHFPVVQAESTRRLDVDAVSKLSNELSAEIRRSSNDSSRMIRQETRAVIDALVKRKADVASLLVEECREDAVRRNSRIFEALRYVGTEQARAALLKIAQDTQYTDSYALADGAVKAYLQLTEDSSQITQLFSSKQPVWLTKAWSVSRVAS